MKTYQFEEISFWLSFIAFMVSRMSGMPKFLQTALLIIVILNFLSAIYYAYKSVNKKDKY